MSTVSTGEVKYANFTELLTKQTATAYGKFVAEELCTSPDVKICLGLQRRMKNLHLAFLFWKSKLSNEMTCDKLQTHISYWNKDTKTPNVKPLKIFFSFNFKDVRMSHTKLLILQGRGLLSIKELASLPTFSQFKIFYICQQEVGFALCLRSISLFFSQTHKHRQPCTHMWLVPHSQIFKTKFIWSRGHFGHYHSVPELVHMGKNKAFMPECSSLQTYHKRRRNCHSSKHRDGFQTVTGRPRPQDNQFSQPKYFQMEYPSSDDIHGHVQDMPVGHSGMLPSILSL